MTSRSSYERKVSEIFGYVSEANAPEALQTRMSYTCPFLESRCVKPSQHRGFDPDIPFGACSVWHRGTGASRPSPYIICPVRFIQNKQIFIDASLLFSDREGAEVIIIPELDLPVGRIDYILAQYEKATKTVIDFVVLEVMACSTTNTGDILRSLHDILQGKTTEKQLRYGINFRQVISRMVVQILAKAYACESWNKRMVWAIQDVLYQYMQQTTKIDLQQISPVQLASTSSPILFFTYSMMKNTQKSQFVLTLEEIYGGTIADFARIFEPSHLPATDRILSLIQQKIQSSDAIFSLYEPPSAGLGKIGSQLVDENIEDEQD